MALLLITHKTSQGHTHRWKLDPEKGKVFSFGKSKKAHLKSTGFGIAGIHGFFEHRADGWVFVDLGPNKDLTKEKNFETKISQDVKIQVGSNVLQIDLKDPKITAFEFEEATTLDGTSGERRPYQVYILNGPQGKLEMGCVPIGEIWTPKVFTGPKFNYGKIYNEWQVQSLNQDFWIQFKTLYLTRSEELEKLFREQDFSDQKALRRGGLAVALLVVLFAILSFRYNTDPTLELTEEIPKNLLQVRTQQESPIEESSTPEPAFGPEPIAKEQAQPANQESQTPQQAATVTPTQADPAPARPSAAQSLSRLQSSRLQNMLAKASESTTRTPPVATSDGRVEPSLNTLSQLESKLSTGSNGDGTATASKAQIQTGISSGSVQGLQIIQQGLTGRNRVSLLENDSEVEGGLDREVIATYIRSRIGEILYCYERQLSSDPSLAGKVGVHFKIGPSGAVETQSIRESTLRSQVVENCILQKISRWKFPAPKGGIQVVVTYPFLFRSTN